MTKDTTSLSNPKKLALGVQFMFVAFGATVLVPLLTGIDPAVALFTAGIGTLLFHLITKGNVPVFLGSSFAFIAPIQKGAELYGMSGAMAGIIAVGAVYTVMSAVIRFGGSKIIEKLFPPVVVGPVIMVIGLGLAPVGVGMAKDNWVMALVALFSAMISVLYGKGFLKLVPVFIGIVVGFLYGLVTGNVDFTPVVEAAWFQLPKFVMPTFDLNAIWFMLPVAVAPLIEHIGDMHAISAVAKKDFVKKPGLHRTLLGDGIATMFAGFMGGPPNTTYSEVTGAISLTKMTNPAILRISAVTAILFSLCGKLSAFLKVIPTPVLGGIMLLLFQMIATVGIKTLADKKGLMSSTRNQIIVGMILTAGIGGAVLEIGETHLSGIGLASIVGIVLNLILPEPREEKEERMKEEKKEEAAVIA
ncbi:uracil-xanthine permease family protein [Sediminitomix flava]|uniref:Uracil permease n=1 Tax=Sediminitomix flava TaxID=379075 RepID=A0A315Z900_SEDFL|nr:solute carrier family 23 protein [Sediminitomix flava]PWJ41035.1 uracil permease [Sediminitomix flava]